MVIDRRDRFENCVKILEKVSVVAFGQEKPPDFSLMKNCWSFDAVSKSFVGFGLDFA